jgi:hypothetical protein
MDTNFSEGKGYDLAKSKVLVAEMGDGVCRPGKT